MKLFRPISKRGNCLPLLILILLAACRPESPAQVDPMDAADDRPGADRVATEPGSPAEPISLTGEQLYIACQACHALEAGAPHRVGPNLHGIIGQPVASRPGFNYSPAMQATQFVWTRGTLMAWIVNAEGMVPGTWMAYSNIVEADELERLVEYIVEVTATAEQPAEKPAFAE